jgi:hypothetical protein
MVVAVGSNSSPTLLVAVTERSAGVRGAAAATAPAVHTSAGLQPICTRTTRSPADVRIAPCELVESARVPAWLVSEAVPGALVEGLVLPPQLLREKLASSTAASDRREEEWRMEILGEGGRSTRAAGYTVTSRFGSSIRGLASPVGP